MMRVRRSITELQDEYRSGNTKPLDDVMRAWKGIKELPPDDPRSFFIIGGYHGEPFRGAGWGVGANIFWGGYCQHGNVLFPIWHRFYLLRIENALRSIPGCEDVTLPFWDECSQDSLDNGIPWALTDESFVLGGETIPNPLRSYVFSQNIVDHISGDTPNYSKPKGYETVRYPYSGLVGTPADQQATEAHNKQWTYPESVEALNQNIVAWLNTEVVIKGRSVGMGIHPAFEACLHAPNYTVFSNTSSAAAWNDNGPHVVPLENPHNHIHLAVGGFDYPSQADFSPIPGANGDMGENDTAGLDPIFFFHHCFIDRVFWLWQQRKDCTEHLPIIDGYPGTNAVDGQGAAAGIALNSWLSMDTPLAPFADEHGRTYCGRDGINIERQLGYRYGRGSLEKVADPGPLTASANAESAPKVHVTGVNRGHVSGSFLISAFAKVDGERKLIGTEAVLSRWHVEGCANCQTHINASASFPLHGLDPEVLGSEGAITVEVDTRAGLLGGRAHGVRALAAEEPQHFRVEVR